jgi:hypothetical protein
LPLSCVRVTASTLHAESSRYPRAIWVSLPPSRTIVTHLEALQRAKLC